MKHAWDVFGRDDQLGTLNFVTPERRRAAAASIRLGQTISLTVPLDTPTLPPFGRAPLQHEIYAANDFSWGDSVTAFDTQSSSQWDGLLHVSHKSLGFYGGRTAHPTSTPSLGIDAWARTGIIGRGLLVDVASHWGTSNALSGRALSADDLEHMLRTQGSELHAGDILCLRFGWPDAYRTLDEGQRDGYMARPRCDGVSAVASTAEFLWNAGVAALVADNPTVESQPGDRNAGFLHHRLLTMLGMPFGEMFDLDLLAEHCRTQGAWDFLFTSVPWNLPGGVASPANAVAVV
ncbi:cyclase family protein [Microbacterium alcoholitolerans]|uniref:cyclase family protein n=1 Tax=unclassified Microbacterium TaxID=2609290 RepID=UPI003D17A93C